MYFQNVFCRNKFQVSGESSVAEVMMMMMFTEFITIRTISLDNNTDRNTDMYEMNALFLCLIFNTQ